MSSAVYVIDISYLLDSFLVFRKTYHSFLLKAPALTSRDRRSSVVAGGFNINYGIIYETSQNYPKDMKYLI